MIDEETPPEPGAQRFARELKELYQAAGSPPFRMLVREAADRRSLPGLSVQRLSDWFSGQNVPANPATVVFLTDALEQMAKNNDTRHVKRSSVWWQELHKAAQTDKRASRWRGGRPRT